MRETPGHPIVVGHAKAKRKDAPHVLFYGHYDVQPADPLELWETEPFAPRLTEGKDGKDIVARGASDDKGQLMTFVEACRAFEANGGLPCNVTFLFEGEEETGSPSLPGFLAAHKDELSAPDLALVCDTSMWNASTPAITVMLRGLALEEVIIKGPSHDLHSGMFGGPVLNPIHVLAKIIADLHDIEGKVTLPGFYASVPEIPEDIAEQWRAIDFDEAKWLSEIGLTRVGGETGPRNHRADLGAPDLRREWNYRRLHRRGIEDGAAGAGVGEIFLSSRRQAGRRKRSSKASAASCASVCRRTPRPNSFRMALRTLCNFPSARRRSIARAARLRKNGTRRRCSPAAAARSRSWAAFKRDLNMDSLMIGFAHDDDRIHSPNEKYSYTSFHKGTRSWARVLHALAAA